MQWQQKEQKEVILTDSERESDHSEDNSSCFISTDARDYNVAIQFLFINFCYIIGKGSYNSKNNRVKNKNLRIEY